MTPTPKPQLLGMLAGLFLAAGLVLSSAIATKAWLRVKTSQFISVKGSARKNIKSDLAIWKGSFTTHAETLLQAQKNLKTDAQRVRQFLTGRGVTNLLFTAIAIEEMRGSLTDAAGLTHQQILGYRVTQSVRAELGNVERAPELEAETTALIEQGVMFTAQAPDYLYTRAGEAKVEMLAEATRDARNRGEQIATQGGRTLGRLTAADMGVIQIAPIHSGQTSWEGMNDTTTLEKTITAVVTAAFELK